MSKTRRNHAPQFKAKVALEALAGEKTIHEIAAKHQVHPNQVTQWRRQLIDQAASIFGKPTGTTPTSDREALLAKIGELTVQNDFFARGARQMTTAERLQRVERENPVVPIARQCAWLGVPRSSVYYQGKPAVSEEDLSLMKRLDALHLQHPFLGSRRLRDRLERDGVFVNRKRIQRLMQVMGIKTLYPRRKTSAPGPGHRIYPYLLRGMTITRPNQVWCADVTYIPMARGFCYLVAIMDWATRAVLSWRLATTLEADSCVEALEEALELYGAPQIFNTDQGAQFTSEAFTDVLKAHTIDISMDGKGCWRDNVFVERLWRSVKYEEVYLKAYASIPEARASLAKYFHFYNHERPHQALDRRTPWEAYTTASWDLAA
ncbi:IS3 family transposase [Acidiferrobacter thiooxydans]|uniref:Integrase n=1 Tax=Acidiferrobacter thiooxydans TaxID=163359 RepID=A0A368HG32_9GAMM|nr:IS3 family transposase [Acidiferrobacter thiooxydans]RCN56212.1 integrase [Acidiferrobacter thiooxydans]